MTDHAELQRLAEAEGVTPGPWEVQPPGQYTTGRRSRRYSWAVVAADRWVVRGANLDSPEADAAYIAAASPDVVLALLAEIAALREALRQTATVLHLVHATRNDWPFDECEAKTCSAARAALADGATDDR